MDYILIFKNTHDALHCERVLTGIEINVNIIPTPLNITKSCGISISVNHNDLNKVVELIDSNKIKVISIYDLRKDLIIDCK